MAKGKTALKYILLAGVAGVTATTIIWAKKQYAKLLHSTYTWILDGQGAEIMPKKIELNDVEIALVDVIKLIFQILIQNMMVTSKLEDLLLTL